MEALTTILASLIIAFIFSWKLSFVVLGFLPLMIATGIIHNKILMGFAKGDKQALGKAGKVSTGNGYNIISFLIEIELYSFLSTLIAKLFFFFLVPV